MKKYAIVLAAGKGTRMKSELPKVMHPVNGVPMIEHLVSKLEEMSFDEIIVVIGHKSELIIDYLRGRVKYVEQKEQLGTGHAVKQAASVLGEKEGRVLILTGDTPLLSKDTLLTLLNEKEGANGAVLTAIQENPSGYGRIKREHRNNILGIVEEKDASESDKRIKEVNSGIFAFDNRLLFEKINQIKNNNQQGEYYLTDIVEIFNKENLSFKSMLTHYPEEVMGINDKEQLAKAEEYFKKSKKNPY